MFLPVLVLSVLGSTFEVGGTATCPSPAEVSARVQAMLPGDADLQHRAEVDAVDGALRVTFFTRAGVQVAERTLSATGSCEELADTVAVVLAAWEAELSAEAPPPEAKASPLGWAVQVGAIGSWAQDQLAAGGLLGVDLGPTESRWGGRLVLTATSFRSQPLGTGQVQWLRAGAGLGPRVWLVRRPVQVELTLELIGALLVMQGVGYAENETATAFDPGLGGGVRASLPFQGWAIWAELSASGYLLRHTGVVDGATGAVPAAPFELALRVGIAFGRP